MFQILKIVRWWRLFSAHVTLRILGNHLGKCREELIGVIIFASK